MSKFITKNIRAVEKLKDSEGWFIRLYDLDGGYATLCSCESEDEAEVVRRVVTSLIYPQWQYRKVAVESLDDLLRPLAFKAKDGGAA